MSGNYEESSARRGKPRFVALCRAKQLSIVLREAARALAFNAKGGKPASHGFTMAEILLSLTIIGVVAAITLPSLTGNINERTWNTQRKALYARFSQGLALMPALNGYGTLTEDENHSVTADTAAETFVTEGLSKVLKINNICDSNHLSDCGIPSKIVGFDGNIAFSQFPATLIQYNSAFNFSIEQGGYLYKHSQIDSKIAAFETANGECIAVYYNPYCGMDSSIGAIKYMQPAMCANFIYDLNGNKGPNTVGKDIGFITAFYSADSNIVTSVPNRWVSQNRSWRGAAQVCKDLGDESRLPNRFEASSLSVNCKLLGNSHCQARAWTADKISPERAWSVNFSKGLIYKDPIDYELPVMCIKR